MTYYDNPLDELKGKTVDAYEMAVKIYEMSKKLKNEDTINGLGYATALLFEMATKALEQEPIYYPPCQDCHTKMNEIVRAYNNMKSCDNAISRADMLDAIGHGTTYTSEDLQRIIKALPPVRYCGARMVEPQESEEV